MTEGRENQAAVSGMTITPEQKEVKKATEKAMNLLLQQDRTEKELEERLYRTGFSEHASECAMNYVKSFGYVDDFRYASNYIAFHKRNRSKKEIRYKLTKKGVDSGTIALAMEEYENADEQMAICCLAEKRLHGRTLSELEYEERNKLIAYLARKGFPVPQIKHALSEKWRLL